ncbi:sideroflexin-2 isoform X2 [Hydra vulgaris]|uniref:Sidoreflexin n=1 Tax=Hydra vulgaris TaxID=6087 RepID=A0ABM4BHZ0_HYDVU
MSLQNRINLDAPRWPQDNFVGRFKHFWSITDWRNGLNSEETFNNAKILLNSYRLGNEPPGTTTEQIWHAKKLYESCYHPDSGEKMNLIGRMSFQVPGGMLITGCMMQFYRTVPQVVFWQWVNQSFNALVNFTNRNAKSEISNTQIGIAYASATSGAMVVALGLNSLVKTAPPLLARYVPFAAVAAANCINIPLMRQREIINGIAVYDENGAEVGFSKNAAYKGIMQVCVSRITMAAPGMLLIPLIMQKLETYPWMQKIKPLHAPLQVLLCGISLTFMVPAACAMFPQRSSLEVGYLDPHLQQLLSQRGINTVYFNKGL